MAWRQRKTDRRHFYPFLRCSLLACQPVALPHSLSNDCLMELLQLVRHPKKIQAMVLVAGFLQKTFVTQAKLRTGQNAIAILKRAAVLCCIFAINGGFGSRDPTFLESGALVLWHHLCLQFFLVELGWPSKAMALLSSLRARLKKLVLTAARSMKTLGGHFRVGTSGYQYDHWRGLFYPESLAKRHWLSYYAEHFDTVEINNTFYGLPSTETFEAWRAQAPQGFCYGLKFSRYGSHVKRLKEAQSTIRTFLQRARRLRNCLGPILVQLPPNWDVNPDRLASFLKAAPRSVRWAFEFRDPSWLCNQVFTILQNHNAALCIHDMIDDHPRKITADWVYLRFHGDHYSGSYTSEALRRQARWIKQQLKEGRDVFAYFNNDAEGYAVQNAAELKRYVSGAILHPAGG